MTSPAFVPQQTPAEAMANVIRSLCEQIAEKQRQMDSAAQFHDMTKHRLEQDKQHITRDRDQKERMRVVEKQRADGVQAQFDALVVQRDELLNRVERSDRILRRLDQITLDIYHYIVELSGHRDTAKTKAERIALGHVVERLKEIRGMNDAERAATS